MTGERETTGVSRRMIDWEPTEEQRRRMLSSAGLYWRVCEQCGVLGVCYVSGENYICEHCQEAHEYALDAAHAAVRETGLVPALRDHDVDRLAWAAVKAYIEFVPADFGASEVDRG